MTKLLLIALTTVSVIGCQYRNNFSTNEYTRETKGFTTITIDSCEYVFSVSFYKGFLAHKGNCKYCAERRRLKLQRIEKRIEKKININS